MEDIHKQPEPCKLTTNFTTSLRAAPLKKIGRVAELLYYTQVRIRRLFCRSCDIRRVQSFTHTNVVRKKRHLISLGQGSATRVSGALALP